MPQLSIGKNMRKILFITATHGNEQDDVKVMQQLENELPKDEYNYDWIIGNEKAYQKNIRYVDQDLNRSAPGDINSTIYEMRRSAELIKIADAYDVVIDLHGTKTDSGIDTITPYPTQDNLRLALAARLTRNVVWYSKQSEGGGPTVQHLRMPAIELECGPKDTQDAYNLTYATVRRIIEVNHSGDLYDVGTEDSEFFEVYDKLTGSHDPALQDFVLSERDGDSFYPFLSGNEYPNVTCYKMRKVSAGDIQLRPIKNRQVNACRLRED